MPARERLRAAARRLRALAGSSYAGLALFAIWNALADRGGAGRPARDRPGPSAAGE